MKTIIWCLLLALTLPVYTASPRTEATSSLFYQDTHTLGISATMNQTKTTQISVGAGSVYGYLIFADYVYGVNTFQTDSFHHLCFNITDEREGTYDVKYNTTICSNTSFTILRIMAIYILQPLENVYSLRLNFFPLILTSFQTTMAYTIPISSLFTEPVDFTGLNLQTSLLLNGLKIQTTSNQDNNYFFQLPTDSKIVGNDSISFTLTYCEWLQVQIITLTIFIYPQTASQSKTVYNDYREVNITSRAVQTASILTTPTVLFTQNTTGILFTGFSTNFYASSLQYYPQKSVPTTASDPEYLILNQYSTANNFAIDQFNTQFLQFSVYSCPSTQPFYDQASQQCTIFCPFGYLLINSVLICIKCAPNLCTTCNSNLTCETCNQNIFGLQLVNGQCECDAAHFTWGANGDTCDQICGDGLRFTLPCDDGNTVNDDGCSSTCQIETGFDCYEDQSKKSICNQTCGDGKRYVLQCDDDNTNDNDGCSGICKIQPGWTCTNTSGQSICKQICGDGIRIILPCDDGNNIDGDGCSSTCSKEPGWICNDVNKKTNCIERCGDGIRLVNQCDDKNKNNGDGCSSECKIQPGWACWPSNASVPTSKSTCSKKSLLSLKSYNKDPLSNKIIADFQGTIIENKRRLLQTLDGSKYFTPNFPFTQMEVTIPQEDQVRLSISYDQSLNGNTPLSLNYLSTSSSSSPAPQTLTLPAVTQNNLALKVYPSEHYQAVETFNRLTPPFTYVGLFVLLVSYLFVSKLLALQSLFVLQFAYGGLVMLIKLEALMYPYRYLWIFNGYNYINEGTPAPEGRFSAVYYKTEFMDNFNVDFIIFFLFIVIGGVMLLVNRYKPHRQLQIWGRSFACEWQMSGMLFCAQQLMFAFIICMYFGERVGEGVAIGSILLVLYCAYAVWFGRTKERGRSPFGDYRRFFKSTDKNFYSYVMMYRLILSLVMVVESQTIVSLSVLLALNIGWFALLMVKRPYIKQAQLPPIINSLTLIALNIFYLVIRHNNNDLFLDFSTYVPIAVLIIMGSILLFNTGYSALRTVRYFKAKEFAKKLAQEMTTQGNEKTDFSFETGDNGTQIQNQTIPSQLISENSQDNRQESLNMGVQHITPIQKIARMNNGNTEQIDEQQNSQDLEELDHSEVIRDRVKQTPATELRDKPAPR